MTAIRIEAGRFHLRDFVEGDRAAFVRYQGDPRYRALHDLAPDDAAADILFDQFLAWQEERPRRNLQLGLFDGVGTLCGCAGLRQLDDGIAELGIELAPEQWGRFGLARDAIRALIGFGFNAQGLACIVGRTASGNRRVAHLARWFGARLEVRGDGPDWMRRRGWHPVDWVLERTDWVTAMAQRR